MTLALFLLLTIIPLWTDMHFRPKGVESLHRAIGWTTLYIVAACLFALWLFIMESQEQAMLFISGYIVEKALSMDNLIVFAAVFAYFGIPSEFQHRALQWGIAGSALLRLIFITLGLSAFFVFGRMLDFLFGAFVIFTGYAMMDGGGDLPPIDHERRWYMKLARCFCLVTPTIDGRFFIGGAATPLFLSVIALECTDIAFAFDSVPAVIGITRDVTIAYSSIMFAVIGLRAMYFVLEAIKRYTVYLGKSVIAVLLFVGAKMMFHGLTGYDISPTVTLFVIASCLSLGLLLSLGHGPLPSRWWAKK